MRSVADDLENKIEKLKAYDNLGRVYCLIKSYNKALKCHKK